MSRIRSQDTKPEIKVRKYLHAKGLRFRLHNKKLPGKPDLSLKKYKTVVFINGCFWHGHKGCNTWKVPESNTEYWDEKIKANRKRDKRNIATLKLMGWKVIVIWECSLKSKNLPASLEQLVQDITNNLPAL